MDFSTSTLNAFLRRVISLFVIFFLPKYIFASPPFITDDANITPHHHFQYYLDSTYYKGSDATFLSFPAAEIDYGFINGGEIDLLPQVFSYIPTQGSSATGLGDTQLIVKYALINESSTHPEISIGPSIYLPTGSAVRGLGWGKVWYTLPLWVEKNWGPWTTYGGGGYTVNPGQDAENYFFGGWVLQRNFTEKLALGLEYYTQGANGTSNVPISGAYSLLNIGGTYNLNPWTSLLFSVGHNIAGIQLWYSYLGLNWQV